MGDIQLEAVVSSNISAIGFNEETGTMRVCFNGGAAYDATGATLADYELFKSAKSKGQYFNKVLKSAFVWNKIEKKG